MNAPVNADNAITPEVATSASASWEEGAVYRARGNMDFEDIKIRDYNFL